MRFTKLEEIDERFIIPALQGVQVFAISGFKGSGKDTLAEMLQKKIANNSFKNYPKILSFAWPITLAVQNIFNNNTRFSYQDKEKRIPFWSNLFKSKITARKLLIHFGEKMRDIYGSEIWNAILLHSMIANIECGKTCFIIPDVRFHREIDLLNKFKENGADVRRILILRKACFPDWLKMGLSIGDPVEREIIEKDFRPPASEYEWCTNKSGFRYVIKNEGNLKKLEEEVDKQFNFEK